MEDCIFIELHAEDGENKRSRGNSSDREDSVAI